MTVEQENGRRPSDLPRGELLAVVQRFYNAHPGYYRPMFVAQRTGLSTHQVAMTSRYLWTNDLIERHTIDTPTGKRRNVYGLYQPRKEAHAA